MYRNAHRIFESGLTRDLVPLLGEILRLDSDSSFSAGRILPEPDVLMFA